MSQLDDLVAVYGQIDDAVIEDPSLLPKVAAMLPPYRNGAAGWHRALQDWQQQQQQEPQPVQLVETVGVADALNRLQQPPEPDTPEATATTHWLNARKLLASGTLSRISGRGDLPGGADPLALVQPLATDPEQLHSHLRRAGDYPNIEAWPTMMADARTRGLVAAQYATATYVPPIPWGPGSFRVVHSTIKGPSVALRTYFHGANLNLREARKCLDPAIWSLYKPPWCDMQLVQGAPPGLVRYREVVAANCGSGAELTTLLDFRDQETPDGGKILEYRIPDDPAAKNALITIDEGSLEVRPALAPGVGIHFVTTKRIQFETMRQMPTMTLAGLGFLTWVLGWDTLAERFVYRCAGEGAAGTNPGTQPPVMAPPDPSSGAFQDPGFGIGATGGDGTTALINLGLSGLQNALSDCVSSAKSSLQKGASGDYGLTDYLSDLTQVSNEITSNSTALASFAAEMWRSLSEMSGSKAGGGNGPQPGQPAGA